VSEATQERIKAWWRKNGLKASVIPKLEWDELDAAIRADEDERRTYRQPPSCATCKFWRKAHGRDRAIEPLEGRTMGICLLIGEDPMKHLDIPHAYIGLRYAHSDYDHSAFVTDATFGCVQWEGK
jgi:hypothetical protein